MQDCVVSGSFESYDADYEWRVPKDDDWIEPKHYSQRNFSTTAEVPNTREE